MRVCDAAVQVLKDTDNPAVMWGDLALLHSIASRVGMRQNGRETCDKVLDALRKTPGHLLKGYAQVGNRKRVLIFRLPPPA